MNALCHATAHSILLLVTEDVSDFSGGRKHVVPCCVVFLEINQMSCVLFLGRKIRKVDA